MLKKQRMMEQIQNQTKQSSSDSRESSKKSKKGSNSKQHDDKSDFDIYSVCDLAKNHDRMKRQLSNAPKKRPGGFQRKQQQIKKKLKDQAKKGQHIEDHNRHYQLHLTRATANNTVEMKADLDRMTNLKDEYEEAIKNDQSIYERLDEIGV